MARMNMERLAAEARMKRRGTESVHGSGLALTRDLPSRRAAEALAHRVAAWKQEPSIEEAVERARRLPDAKLGGLTPTERDAWTRGILNACED